MILTFADSGLLIAAGRGIGDAAVDAIALLGDPNREFASCFYIIMETLPKAQYHKRNDEAAVYEAYFAKVKTWADNWEAMHLEAQKQASLYGIGAMDALHIAAAILVRADEFVTAEREGKSLFRTPDIRVVSIHSKSLPALP